MQMFQSFYDTVMRIPAGKVASYGTVARLSGYPGHARQVGWALHNNPEEGRIPCHRVLFADGRLSPAFAFGGSNAQQALLEREGVIVHNGRVDMKKFSLTALEKEG